MPGFSGVNTIVDLAATDGQWVKSLARAQTGAQILSNEIFYVAGCVRPGDSMRGVLCSYPGFTGVTEGINPETGLPLSAIDLLIEALAQTVVDGTRRNIEGRNAAPIWPETAVVQPLLRVK